jgi:DHA3 family macrolide efflux protein-like MFS transporter
MNRQADPSRRWPVSFFPIWTGQAFSLIGSKVAQFALIWWLTKLTGSATVLATASLVALVPEIVVSPFAGAYVDRGNRRVVMIVADAVTALASLWLAYVFWVGAMSTWHVYVVMFVRALGSSFHWPAMQASTSLMVPKEQLTRVAGLNQTMNGALNIVGPPLGALLMSVLPLHGVMLVDVGTALLAIVPLLFVQVPQPARTIGDHHKLSLWADIRLGLSYILGWRGLVVLIGSAMVVKIALTPAFALLPLLVSEHFGGDAAKLSLLESVLGIGILVGGAALSAWGGFRRKIYTIMGGVLLLGLAFVVLGLASAEQFVVGLASVFVVGLMIPMVDGPIMAILQTTVAPELQGRVFTVMGSLLWITSPLSLALSGPISDRMGLQVWYLTAGALCLVLGLASFFVPALIHIEDNHAGGSAAPVEALAAEPSPAPKEM